MRMGEVADAFMRTVQKGDSKGWTVKLALGGQEVQWRIDT